MRPAIGDVVIFHWKTETRVHDLPAMVTCVLPGDRLNLSVFNNGYVLFDKALEASATARGQDKQSVYIWCGASRSSRWGDAECWSPRPESE